MTAYVALGLRLLLLCRLQRHGDPTQAESVCAAGRSRGGAGGHRGISAVSRCEPPPVTLALLERGQERYRIYCTPCHSELGDGRGMIVQRGFPAPPSFHIDRLRAAPPQYFYDVITQGHGVMYAFADRVQPADRWAIAAYIRALQRSQHASLADVPPAERGSCHEGRARGADAWIAGGRGPRRLGDRLDRRTGGNFRTPGSRR